MYSNFFLYNFLKIAIRVHNKAEVDTGVDLWSTRHLISFKNLKLNG